MCPACYSAVALFVAGLTSSTVGGASVFVILRQMIREKRTCTYSEETKK